MIFKLYDCDCGVTLNDVNYDFLHVDQVQIDDPEKVKLVRGANAGDEEGLIYREGLKDAKTVTYTVFGMPKELHELLKAAWRDKTRMDAYVVSRADGSSKIARSAVLTQPPRQLQLDDSSESMSTQLVFESFKIDEVHKS
jgi:hypothetical protein